MASRLGLVIQKSSEFILFYGAFKDFSVDISFAAQTNSQTKEVRQYKLGTKTIISSKEDEKLWYSFGYCCTFYCNVKFPSGYFSH